ncbi:MAG: type II secretion system F family protein [Rhodospirillaceae bacterium]|nr:type II secretion system F family protein [Rhodospirillaceae bacterium]
MTAFRYRALTADGRRIQGVIDASDREAALEKLQAVGQLPITVVPASRTVDWKAPLTAFRQWRSRVRQIHVASMTRELATRIDAGMPLDASLHAIEARAVLPALKQVVRGLHDDIQGGHSFSAALERHPRIFDPLYVSTVRAGEAGGSLHDALLRLADYLESAGRMRASVISALAYPAILVSAAGLSLVVLMLFVVPQFMPLFSDAGSTLPLLTRVVFFGSEAFRQYGWAFAVAAAVTAYGAQQWNKQPRNRRRLDRWRLNMPVVGELTQRLETARFARTLGTLTESGVPLVTALQHAGGVIGNSHIREDIDAAIESVEAGLGLAPPLAQRANLSAMAIELIAVGEDTGQLVPMLMKVAEIYDEQTRVALKRVLSLAEPALILSLGAAIALIILSILMAMLGLNDLVV